MTLWGEAVVQAAAVANAPVSEVIDIRGWEPDQNAGAVCASLIVPVAMRDPVSLVPAVWATFLLLSPALGPAVHTRAPGWEACGSELGTHRKPSSLPCVLHRT